MEERLQVLTEQLIFLNILQLFIYIYQKKKIRDNYSLLLKCSLHAGKVQIS